MSDTNADSWLGLHPTVTNMRHARKLDQRRTLAAAYLEALTTLQQLLEQLDGADSEDWGRSPAGANALSALHYLMLSHSVCDLELTLGDTLAAEDKPPQQTAETVTKLLAACSGLGYERLRRSEQLLAMNECASDCADYLRADDWPAIETAVAELEEESEGPQSWREQMDKTAAELDGGPQ